MTAHRAFASTLAVTITAPTAENADAWAETLYDHLHAEYGDEMRLDISVNPPTLARSGECWVVTRGGHIVHTAATRTEAQAVGVYAIRQETDPNVQIEWICPACYGDDQECQDCSEDRTSYFSASGVLTEAEYAVQRRPAARGTLAVRAEGGE